MLEHYPSLKAMYSPDDDNTEVLYFKSYKGSLRDEVKRRLL